MENDSRPRALWIPWALTSVALVAVALIAYSLGAQQARNDAPGAEVTWRIHPFGGFWLFILMLFLFSRLRSVWLGPFPHPWHLRRYELMREYQERDWDAWHRRAHDQMRSAGVDAPHPGTAQPPPT